jgi:hypothetical protein
MKTRKIIAVKPLPGKRLSLKFDDGLEGEFCFTDFFECDKELSRALCDENYFSQVSVNQDFGCIEWPNGYDPSPAVLYAIIAKQKIISHNKIVFDPALGKKAWIAD